MAAPAIAAAAGSGGGSIGGAAAARSAGGMEAAKYIDLLNSTYSPKKESADGKRSSRLLGGIMGLVDTMVSNAKMLFDLMNPILEMLGLIVDGILMAFLPEILHFIDAMATASTDFIDTASGLRNDATKTGDKIITEIVAALVVWGVKIFNGILPMVTRLIEAVVGILLDPTVWAQLQLILVIAVEMIILVILRVVNVILSHLNGMWAAGGAPGWLNEVFNNPALRPLFDIMRDLAVQIGFETTQLARNIVSLIETALRNMFSVDSPLWNAFRILGENVVDYAVDMMSNRLASLTTVARDSGKKALRWQVPLGPPSPFAGRGG